MRKNYGEFTMSEQYFENNESENITKIPINRLKILLYLLLSLAFVIGGAVMFFAQPTRRHSVLELKIIGCLCILFFGLGVVVFIIQFFRKGLIISEKGVEEDASFVSLGLIKWEDIDSISVGKMNNQQVMAISIKPETKDFYLGKVKNPLKKWLIKKNLKRYEHAIPINFLKIKPKELERVLYVNFPPDELKN